MQMMRKGSATYFYNGKAKTGEFILNENTIVFNKKSIMLVPLIGLIGHSLVKGKPILEINKESINAIYQDKFRINKKAIYIEMTNKEKHIFALTKPDEWLSLLQMWLNNRKEGK